MCMHAIIKSGMKTGPNGADNFCEGRMLVCRKKKWFHIRENDLLPAYPQRFEWAANFSYGCAAVKGKDGYYHIKPDGTPAYEDRFALVTSFFVRFANPDIIALAADKDGTWLHTIRLDGTIISSIPA